MLSNYITAVLLSLPFLSYSAPVADASYDVIVIGSGPAGIIVANRMSAAGKKTLLLEQGGPSYAITGGTERPAWLDSQNLSRVDVPGLYSTIFSSTNSSLMCTTKLYPTGPYSGCTAGGNSAINAGLFFQPPQSDWDTYFPAGWHNADMQSAINKTYAMQPSTDEPSQDHQFYLQSGYNAAKQWLVQDAGYAEVPLNENHAHHNKTKVFGHTIYGYEGGQRSGPVKTYLQDAIHNHGLTFQMNTKVVRVIRNGAQATGVEVSQPGSAATKIININSKGRVIVSGGALFSPQVLMWSGIGDSSALSKLGQEGHLKLPPSQWINNTEVGNGLFDNPNTFIELSATSISSYTYEYQNPIAKDSASYLQKRTGPYTFAGQTSAFWDYIHMNGKSIGCQGTIGTAGYSGYTNASTITLNVYGTSGLGTTGRLNLNNDGVASPSIDFYQSGTSDAQAISQFIYNIFQKLPSTLTPLNLARSSSVDAIKNYITSSTAYTRGNVNHWSSSCRLGKCVDANTQVLHTNNIHVVDASISAPLTTNPMLGTMIIAERASELILALDKTPTVGSNGGDDASCQAS